MKQERRTRWLKYTNEPERHTETKVKNKSCGGREKKERR